MDQWMDKLYQMHEIDPGRDIYGVFHRFLSILIGLGRDQSSVTRISALTFIVSAFGITEILLIVLLNFKATKFWRNLTDQREKQMISEPLKTGCVVGSIFAVYLLSLSASMNVFLVTTALLNREIALRNSSRSPIVFMDFSYPFLEGKDHYLISSLHLAVAFSIYSMTLAWGALMYINNISLACGFLTVLRYCGMLEDTFCFHVLAIEVGGVILLAMLNFYLIYGSVHFFKKTVFGGVVLGSYFVLFSINMAGQLIIDHSEKVIISIYQCDWYLSQIHERRTIQMIMVKSQYPIFLTSGKISVVSLESFSQLMKLSFSYFTAITSMDPSKN